jgi:integrase
LSRTGLIRQDKIKYYVYWVIKFLNYCNYRPIKPFNQNISPYLEQYLCERRNSIPLTINTLIEKQEKSKSAQQSMPWESVLSQFGNNIRLRHYSPRTEKFYRIWIKRFCRFMKSCDPAFLKSEDVKKFLSHLATQEKVSASTQNQAFNALLFLFRNVLHKELKDLADTVRAKRRLKLPVVLSREEVQRIFSCLSGQYLLMAKLLYGSGLRLLECIRLRVKDIDFNNNLLVIHSGKGDKDRTTVLPESLKNLLMFHLGKIKELHAKDLKLGYGETTLPYGLSRKYPNKIQASSFIKSYLNEFQKR